MIYHFNVKCKIKYVRHEYNNHKYNRINMIIMIRYEYNRISIIIIIKYKYNRINIIIIIK